MEGMTTEIKIITPNEYMNYENSNKLRETILKSITKEKIKKIILDLRKVKIISPFGIKDLLFSVIKVEKSGRSIKIKNVNYGIQKELKNRNFLSVFKNYF